MAKAKGAKRAQRSKSPSAKRAGGGRRAAASGSRGRARKGAKKGARRSAAKSLKKKAGRKSAGRPAAKQARKPSRRSATKRSTTRAASAKPRRTVRKGGTGRERELAQTPETGRTVKGRTNPMRTIRSTGTPAGAGDSRHVPALERQRRQLRDIEEMVPEPPSSLNMDRRASAARTGRAEMREARRQHTETSPAMTGGDVDADWEDAYAVGDEAPGGDNPTPDQDVVDDIGRALGIEYQDNEELKASDKIAKRDKHRWELDPASSEDYRDRD
ncbi:MAG TPA: DUF6335 family protein [Vicinamibacterales bacterium]|jgi:Family of unknown function (DUF6335)|nr:DUF6335 family protein [Vicinamibacterales bacterium]